jgi:DNA-binding transcriptional MerR regulator
MTAEAAAALLGTSPTTLSLWEERFGYPMPVCSGDGQRLYPDEMMIALRDALTRELSIASAITTARRTQGQGGRSGMRHRVAAPPEDPGDAQ